jgi:acyl-CoA reductase-like NAD-dependent aldehyde dehydrogenase
VSDFQHYPSLIAGELVSGQLREIVNPATGSAFASYGVADPALVSRAVNAARAALPQWRATELAARRQVIRDLADVIEHNADSLGNLLKLEQGKPAAQAAGEVEGAWSVLRYYAGLHQDRADDLFLDETAGYLRVYAPLGVVAGIIPWNMPLLLAAVKIGPALLAGNTVIVKPAPSTPATTLEFARLAAGVIPPGVLQVLGDDGTVGPALTCHPGIDKIAFTGSTASGQRVMAAAAGGLKKLTLELGGNDAAIVLDDADIELAATTICKSAFENAGQVCAAIKRVYVHSSVKDKLSAAIAARVQALNVGSGNLSDVDVGPVQNRAQFEKATALMASAAEAGVILAQAGAHNGAGFFITPTVFGGLSDDHALVCEEQFAPLLPILTFASDDEAIARANATEFALTGSVWSANAARARSVARRIEASLVCINAHNVCGLDMGLSMAKQSGSGWLLGDEGVKEYMQARLINTGS